MMNRRQFSTGTISALLALQTRTLFASPARSASSDLRLKDYLRLYDFPEELLSYPLTFDNPVKREDLRLVEKGARDAQVFQLTDIVQIGGTIKTATLHFRSDLKMNADKTFNFTANSTLAAPASQPIPVEPSGTDRAAIKANRLQILVPAGTNRPLNLPVAQAPAPLLALSREDGKWVGAGKLEGPAGLTVLKLDTHVVEQGPLFVRYAITYTFSENRTYAVTLTVQHNDSHVEIDELNTGFTPADRLAFRFSYKDGIDPNGRLLMANGGYSTGGSQQGASGPYDKDVKPSDKTGLLPIKLGIYTPQLHQPPASHSLLERQRLPRHPLFAPPHP